MEKESVFNIAIDGPAGAGKSTIAKLVAKQLGFVYVDTGAMYRAMALYFLRQGIGAEEEAKISAASKDAAITIRYQDGNQQVLLNDEDVSGLIRTEAVGNMASAASVYPAVRAHLLDLQRNLAASADVIMDGRDIGTCILPDADVKFFLTASPEVRAMRRYKELKEKGLMCNLAEIEQDIIERDRRDSTRQTAPLRQAEDAILIDGSEMAIEQVVEAVIQTAIAYGLKIEKRKGEPASRAFGGKL